MLPVETETTALKYTILTTTQREALAALVKDGWVSQTSHPNPSLPFVTYSYSHTCQTERHWTPETRMARGLVVNKDTWEILSRPFDKFFNLGEPTSMEKKADAEGKWKQNPMAVIPGGPAEATVKLDGSLGVHYWAPHSETDDRPAIYWATRGSFTSEQADVANEIWRATHEGGAAEDRLYNHPEFQNCTLLVEIIAPNCGSQYRLEFPYRLPSGNNMLSLILIGARNRRTGADLNHADLTRLAEVVDLPVVELVKDFSVTQLVALAAELPQELEGFVLRWPDGTRLKVKGTAWVQADWAISGASAKNILAAWVEGDETTLLEGLPTVVLRSRLDLMASWAQLAAGIAKTATEECRRCQVLSHVDTNDEKANRKAFAALVLQTVHPDFQPIVFNLYSGYVPRYREYVAKYVLRMEAEAKATAAGPQLAEVTVFEGAEEAADV